MHVEHGRRGGDADRVAAEGVEVPGRPPELRQHRLPGDDPGDRQPVAHRLAHRHDVRHQPGVPLVAPQLRAGPAEPGLHLVGDVEPARRAHQRRRPGRGTRPGRAARRRRRTASRPGTPPAAARAAAGPRWRRRRRPRSPIRARRGHGPDVRAQRDVGAQAGGELRHRGGHPVVGVLGHDHPGTPGAGPGDPQREVVRLAPGAGEHRVRRADRCGSPAAARRSRRRRRSGTWCAC